MYSHKSSGATEGFRAGRNMTHIYANEVLTAHGWLNAVRLRLQAGRIVALEADVPPHPDDERHDVIVPALGNVHSHAFQRGMAGFAEVAGDSADSFWSWRDVMYRFALRMNPAQFEAIASQAYMEMLEAGFGRVGEFHYLHHAPDGAPYADIAEMAGRLAAAAECTGMGLCLLPVFYAHASFGGVPPRASQRRFINTLERYQRIVERSRSLITGLPGGVVGVAPHSLRAVTEEELLAVTSMAGSAPVHIHIAEQTAEVAECVAWSGRRPVAWLLEHAPVDEHWCLVHATHVETEELAAVARTGAVVGLCPITEANLGDGVFPVAELLHRGGRFGIGTDSNVHISLAGELALLEYAQRLMQRARNVIAQPGVSTGRAMMNIALAGADQVLGGGGGRIASGAAADLVSLNRQHPALASRHGDALLDAWIFASSGHVVDCVWVAGQQWVRAGRHVARDRISSRFQQAMKELCR